MKITKLIKTPFSEGGALDEGIMDAYNALLPTLFDHADDIVVAINADGVVFYANSQFLALASLSREELIGSRFSDLEMENGRIHAYQEMMQKVISIKKPATLSRVINTSKSLYELCSISPIVSQQATLGAILVAKSAVLEKPLDEQEMKRKTAYQETMMNSIPFPIWLKDKDSHILAANEAYAEMAGVTDTKLLEGKTDFDLFPHHLAEGYVEDDLKVIESGDKLNLAERIKGEDGVVFWAETYKAPVIVDGEIIGTIGYARDISEQKELLSTISEKDLQFTALLQNLPLSIVRYDADCRRTFINIEYGEKEAQNLLGTTPEEAWSPTVINMTAEEFQAKLMHVLFHGETQTFEMHCDVGGETIVNMMNLLPEFDEHHQVVGAIAIANDVTEISKYRHDLEHMAYHDALTALPNRAFLNQQLRLAASDGMRFGLLFMDLDFFKTINDTLGHEVGDGLLVDAAKRIVDAVRDDDIVARIGGDEFAILVSNLRDDANLAGLATKIADKLSSPFHIEGINFFVTASIGIVCYPTDSEEVEDLMKYADTAMYEAKKRGRNNHQFYTPDMTQQAMEHLAIATALRYAIKKDELFLLFQPKVDIATGAVLGAEALLRWHGNVLGQILPDKFIPIAEESGLIIEIGTWVLRTACEVAVQLNQRRDNPLNIAVNVSSKEFVGNDYIKNLQECLMETGCKPEWLTLEITESLLLQDTGETFETLKKIDEMGITLSIDDFGTGYSALAYLSKFPIRQVKIDRSFVMDICNTQSAASLIKAIIAMADSLKKQLVAEGVETNEQAALIKEYGCHEAQGYLYSKPLSFAEFVHMVEQQRN